MTTFVLKNLRRLFDKYAVARTEHDALVKSTTKIFSNFVAFSENPNFTYLINLVNVHCKCLHTNYRLIIVFICYYYTWKCVKVLKVVDFKHYRQISVFSAANSKLHSNYWYLDVKWNCILIYSKITYINCEFLQLKICN